MALTAALDDASAQGLDSEGLLMSLVSSETVQEATGLDRQGLLRKFSASWSAESAFKECMLSSIV